MSDSRSFASTLCSSIKERSACLERLVDARNQAGGGDRLRIDEARVVLLKEQAAAYLALARLERDSGNHGAAVEAAQNHGKAQRLAEVLSEQLERYERFAV